MHIHIEECVYIFFKDALIRKFALIRKCSQTRKTKHITTASMWKRAQRIWFCYAITNAASRLTASQRRYKLSNWIVRARKPSDKRICYRSIDLWHCVWLVSRCVFVRLCVCVLDSVRCSQALHVGMKRRCGGGGTSKCDRGRFYDRLAVRSYVRFVCVSQFVVDVMFTWESSSVCVCVQHVLSLYLPQEPPPLSSLCWLALIVRFVVLCMDTWAIW